MSERKKEILGYSILFIFCAVLIHITNLYTLRGFIKYGDSYNEYYPVFIYIGKYIRSLPSALFHGKLPVYDFTAGFGENVFEAMNWLGFGDPFNFISVFFPVRYSAVGYTLAQLLRIYFAGLVFMLWTRRRQASLLPAVIGSLFYAFSMYTALFGLNFPTFMTALTTLPLLALGVDQLLSSGRRISFYLVFGMALQGLCGFYWIYMDSLFFLLYIPLSALLERKLSIPVFFKRFFSIFLNYLMGLALSAAFFLPCIHAFFSSNRTDAVAFSLGDYLNLYSLEEYIVKLDSLLTPHGTYADGLYLGIGFLFCLIILLGPDKEYRFWKLLSAIVFIGYLLPGFGRIMNCFAYPAERWIYLLYFVFAQVIVLGLDYINTVTPISKILFSLCFPVWLLLAFKTHQLSDISFTIRFAFISLLWIGFLVALFCIRDFNSRRTQRFFCLCTLLFYLFGQMAYFYPKQIFGLNHFSTFRMNGVYNSLLSDNSRFVKHSTKDTEEGVFRTDLTGECLDVSLITGTNSTSSYYSAHNTAVYSFFRTFGFSSSLVGGSVSMSGLDGRLPAEMLFSVRSYADPVYHEAVKENPYYLPLGFTYDSYLPMSALKDMDLTDANALLPDVVFLEDKNLPATVPSYNGTFSRAEQVELKIDFGNITKDGNTICSEGDQVLTLTPLSDFNFDPAQEYYLVLEGLNTLSDIRIVTIGSKQLRLVPDGATASYAGDCMVKIASSDVFDANTPLTITLQGGLYSLSDIRLYSVNTEHYKEAYEYRSRYTLQNLEFGVNTVSGTISIPSSQILFMSIPYDPFWNCTIDNQKATILKADNGFCAVVLPAGDHEICFSYSSPINTAGLLISGSNIVLLLLIIIRRKVRSHPQN
ncbi:MAG: YfhO family protein [Lachnospiraceae bacterium]|nr:YfhO family protein [Lachnospiraceae bacterium]